MDKILVCKSNRLTWNCYGQKYALKICQKLLCSSKHKLSIIFSVKSISLQNQGCLISHRFQDVAINFFQTWTISAINVSQLTLVRTVLICHRINSWDATIRTSEKRHNFRVERNKISTKRHVKNLARRFWILARRRWFHISFSMLRLWLRLVILHNQSDCTIRNITRTIWRNIYKDKSLWPLILWQLITSHPQHGRTSHMTSPYVDQILKPLWCHRMPLC